MFDNQPNSHKLPSDPAFAAAAAAAARAASNPMSSAHHHPHHISAAAAAASSQFVGIPVPLATDPAHSTFPGPPPTQSHLFDRPDQPQHNLGLSQSPAVFPSQHQTTHHQQHRSHIDSSKSLRAHHHDLPSASQSLSRVHQQHVQHQSNKGKRITISQPAPSLRQPDRTVSMSNPADPSHQHAVTMVGQDGHTFTRLTAPLGVNVAHPSGARNDNPLRNDGLYPHIAARVTHPQQHSSQHQPIASGIGTRPEQHITLPPQAAPQQHPGGLRNVAASFPGTQLSDGRVQAGARLSFEEEARRRAGNTHTNPQRNPAVMLQFSDGYMTQQQDGLNENRQRVMSLSEPLSHHQRDPPQRFDADPGTLVAPSMAYDIKDGEMDQKRLAGSGGAPGESMLPPGGLDAAAMNRQSNLITTRTPARVGADGRPINASVFMHGTVEKRVTCESCGLLFGDVGSLKRHAARSHRASTGKGPVYCPQCNASLKNEQNLRRHIAVCHSGDQENRCDMCNASFSSRGSLRIHQQQVHNVAPGAKNGRSGRGGRGAGRVGRVGGVSKSSKSDKSYVCDMCTDTFKWKGNLKRHRELRHLHLRPFFCQFCNASFGTKSNMRVHLITHNNAENK